MKRLDPDYKGFRGHRNEPNMPGKTPLVPLNCSVCGRRRNVPKGVAVEQRDSFVCMSCHDEGRVPGQAAVEA